MKAVPAGPLLFDTGIYIRFARGEDYAWLIEDTQIVGRTFLTAVVAAELYAGTRDRREKRFLDEFCRAYQLRGRFLCPSAIAWIDAGILLRRGWRTFGQMNFAHHFRDLLIALEAVQAGATLVAENVRDFDRWKRLLSSGGKTLKIFDPA